MKFRIRHKMLFSFMLVITLTGTVSIFAIVNLTRLDRATRIIAEKKFSAIIAERKLSSVFSNQVTIEKKYFIFTDNTYLELFKKHDTDFLTLTEEIKTFNLTPDEKAILDKIESLYAGYMNIFEKKLRLLRQNNFPEIEAIERRTAEKSEAIKKSCSELITVTENVMDRNIKDSSRMSHKASVVSLIVFILTFIAGITLSILITRNISDPISELQTGTRKISEGNLDHRLKRTHRSDELDELFRVFNDMACKLKEGEELKANFMSMVTHDLRNPLNIIQGYIESFMEDRLGSLEKQQKDILNIMDQNAEHILRLVSDLSDLSLIESNIFKMEMKPFDMAELVKTAVTQMSTIAGQEGRKIKYDSAVPGSVPVNGDRDRLLQVLNNLVKNAIKYSLPKTTIYISMERREGEGGNTVTVSVRNESEPIPGPELSLLFNKFTRTTRSKTGKVKGLGLGLFIAKTIIEAHHGRIWAESSAEKGTTFSFSLPAAEKPDA